MLGVGLGAEGAGGVEERGGFLGLVRFHHAPADPVVRLGLEVVGEVIDFFQQPLVADEHVLDVAFLAAGAGRLKPGEGEEIGGRGRVGGEAVEIGDSLGGLADLGVGPGTLHEGRVDALVFGIFRDEIGERPDRALGVSRVGEAPSALVEEARAVRLAEQGGVDLGVGFRGLGGVVFGEEGLGLHQHRGVDAGVVGVEPSVDLEEGVHLIDDVLALDLEEAVEAVVGGLEGEVILGFDEALDLAEKLAGLGGAVDFHHGPRGDHQAHGFLFALSLEGAFAEHVEHRCVILFRVKVLHQRGLGVGAELLHALAVEDEAEVGSGEVGIAELGGGDGSVEGGVTAVFGDGARIGDGAEKRERLLELAGLEGELADLGLRLGLEKGSRRIRDHAVVGGDCLAVAAEQAVAVTGEKVALGFVAGLRCVRGEALEERRGEGIFAFVVVIGGEGVGGRAGVPSLAVAVQQGAEAALRVIDQPGLVETGAEIPPSRLGVRVVGEFVDVFGKNVSGAQVEITARLEIDAGLRGVEKVFPPCEEIVPGVRAEVLGDDTGARRLLRVRRQVEGQEKQRESFQCAGSFGAETGFAKRISRWARGAGWRRKCSRCLLSCRCR